MDGLNFPAGGGEDGADINGGAGEIRPVLPAAAAADAEAAAASADPIITIIWAANTKRKNPPAGRGGREGTTWKLALGFWKGVGEFCGFSFGFRSEK